MKALCPKNLIYSLIILGFSIAMLFAAVPFVGINAKAVTVDSEGVYEISSPEDLTFFAEHGGDRVTSRARLTANVLCSGEAIFFENGKFELDLSGYSLEYEGTSPFLTLTPDTILVVTDFVGEGKVQSLGTVFDNKGILTLAGGEYISENCFSTESTSAVVNRNTLSVTGGAKITSMQGVDSYSVFNTGTLTVEEAELSSSEVFFDENGLPSITFSDFTLRSNAGSVTLSECSVGGMIIDRADGSAVIATDFIKEGEAIYRIFDNIWYSDTTVFPEGRLKGAFEVLSAPIRLLDKTTDLTYEAHLAPDTLTLSVTAISEDTLSYLWDYDGQATSTLNLDTASLPLGESRFVCKIYSEDFMIETEITVALNATDVSLATIESALSHTYGTGESLLPPSLSYKGKALEEGRDYTVVYLRDGKECSDFSSVGSIEMKIEGRSAFFGEITATYIIKPSPLTLTAGDKWEDSNEIPTYTQKGTLAEGDTLSVSLIEDGHSVSFLSARVTAANGTDATSNYNISLIDGLRHIPSDSYLYDSTSHYKACIYGCEGALAHRSEHKLTESNVCSDCDANLSTAGKGEEKEEKPENKTVILTVILSLFGLGVPTFALIFYLYKRKI